jgi:hypothetical protein
MAPNNGHINEHWRGPSVPVICVPNKIKLFIFEFNPIYLPKAMAMVLQQPINNDKRGFWCHVSGKA